MSNKKIKLLSLTRYGSLGASSRLRSMQYFPTFETAGIQVQWQPFFRDVYLNARYQYGKHAWIAVASALGRRMRTMNARQNFDVVWIEKEALPWCPLWLELALLSGVPFVLDYDDAVFHNYDLHSSALVRLLYSRRLDGLMAKAALVVCGNAYLAQRAAAAGAAWVEELPTVIDLERYNVSSSRIRMERGCVSDVPKIVWIGSPSTARYLELLSQPLQILARRMPFVLRVIGAEFALPGVHVECVKWTAATEVTAIAECDVGVMPLLDSAWERGKCGYKLIQYMACGLPVVASDVGVNAEIVQEGLNGYLARNSEQWLDALVRLLNAPALRRQLGQAGRQRVEDSYCIQKTAPVLAQWLRTVAEKK